MAERFRFVSDDDGHRYMIPADKREEFNKWVEAGPYWENYEGEDFGRYGIDGVSDWSFENPIEDR